MKFIRTLWGDPKYFAKEIPKKPLFDEVVYVWGNDANDFLVKLGYDTILVSEDNPYLTDYRTSTYGVYILKLEALKLGIEQFGEVIFMDWDVKNVKPIDEQFYKDLEGKELLILKYEFNEYIDVTIDDTPYHILYNQILEFFSNEMTNNMGEVKDSDYIWLYNWIQNNLEIIS